jgi:limonene-1,2-epoxide hydrolase
MPNPVEIPAAVSAAIIDQNWDQVRSHLAEDILYRPGSRPEIHGREEALQMMIETFTKFARFTGHRVRQVWEGQGRVAIEMDAIYRRIRDDKEFVIACTDIYRVEDNKIREWRVYADVSPLFLN